MEYSKKGKIVYIGGLMKSRKSGVLNDIYRRSLLHPNIRVIGLQPLINLGRDGPWIISRDKFTDKIAKIPAFTFRNSDDLYDLTTDTVKEEEQYRGPYKKVILLVDEAHFGDSKSIERFQMLREEGKDIFVAGLFRNWMKEKIHFKGDSEPRIKTIDDLVGISDHVINNTAIACCEYVKGKGFVEAKEGDEKCWEIANEVQLTFKGQPARYGDHPEFILEGFENYGYFDACKEHHILLR